MSKSNMAKKKAADLISLVDDGKFLEEYTKLYDKYRSRFNDALEKYSD